MVNYTLDSSSNIVPVSLTDERKGGCEADFSHLLFYKLNQKHWLVIAIYRPRTIWRRTIYQKK